MSEIEKVYTALKDRIDFDNLVPTCMLIAQEVQRFTHLNGTEKLQFAQDVLRFAVKESDRPDKKQLLATIETTVPYIMQAAKIASKLPIQNLKFPCCSK